MDRNPDKLAIAIALLLSDAKEKFTYERQLHMFQFQCWLLDTHKQDVSFATSAIRFRWCGAEQRNFQDAFHEVANEGLLVARDCEGEPGGGYQSLFRDAWNIRPADS